MDGRYVPARLDGRAAVVGAGAHEQDAQALAHQLPREGDQDLQLSRPAPLPTYQRAVVPTHPHYGLHAILCSDKP
jgi:hypothetical protein